MALQDTDLLPLWRTTDSTNRKITVADFATYVENNSGEIQKPGKEGSFVLVENAEGIISFSEIIDGGAY